MLQLPEDFFERIDALQQFEDRLIAAMPRTARVDGHDVGGGTINFFVYTAFPDAAFREHLGTNAVERRLRVAHRPIDGDGWTELWPRRPRRGQPPFAYRYGEPPP